jgi:hypothetical protein
MSHIRGFVVILALRHLIPIRHTLNSEIFTNCSTSTKTLKLWELRRISRSEVQDARLTSFDTSVRRTRAVCRIRHYITKGLTSCAYEGYLQHCRSPRTGGGASVEGGHAQASAVEPLAVPRTYPLSSNSPRQLLRKNTLSNPSALPFCGGGSADEAGQHNSALIATGDARSCKRKVVEPSPR